MRFVRSSKSNNLTRAVAFRRLRARGIRVVHHPEQLQHGGGADKENVKHRDQVHLREAWKIVEYVHRSEFVSSEFLSESLVRNNIIQVSNIRQVSDSATRRV